MRRISWICLARRHRALRGLRFGGAFILAVFGFGLAAGPQAVAAAGDLLVAPTRVVFESRTRSAVVNLVNTGVETATYRISIVNRRMREDGSFEVIETPQGGEKFAGTLIRYGPRRVVLAPHEPQAIRILVRKPRDLAEGEYRSHLLFRAVPDVPKGTPYKSQKNAGQLSIRLTPVYGVTIPLIVRHGNLKSAVSITGAELERGKGSRTGQSPPTLRLRFERSGERSIYGDVTISLPDPNGKTRVLRRVRGIAIYTPNRTRTLRIPLSPEDAALLAGRRVKVQFSAPAKDGGAVFAEHHFQIR
jgi:P pilus assembly chaperone PapD